ncbi:WD repeat-containing protein 44 [Tripterygium wilfordii]|uniref:WD repeat-containing protein 44 n=1 Tax=Tripterygium wilfordii TaxID=458696 RepID=A0A7J7C2E5_TRIWF|nr:WD repeat-containing protein 44-like [Tripterygium wilfordii]KAF5728324.1 WD repeat-containing protein 44 [Tripterygium wilfordii]
MSVTTTTTTTITTLNGDEEEENEERFYESLDRLLSSNSTSCSTSDSGSDSDPNPNSPTGDAASSSSSAFPLPRFPRIAATKYDIWISQPASISERRLRLLRDMGLSGDSSLSRSKPGHQSGQSVDFSRSVNSDRLRDPPGIVRSKSDGYNDKSDFSVSSPSILCYDSSSLSNVDFVNNNCDRECDNNNGNNAVGVDDSNKDDGYSRSRGGVNKSNEFSPVAVVTSASSPNKPPSGRNLRRMDESLLDCISSNGNLGCNEGFREPVGESECHGNGGGVGSEVCTIKNLDNGKEFMVNEIKEDGTWNKLKEVATGRQLTIEEFEMSVGTSPIVQELMRRQNVEEGHRESLDSNANNGIGSISKSKKKGSWFRSIKNVASSITNHKERRSSDERDTSSEKGGRRSSSATDDSQDGSFHGPERVRVRQYGKSCKEFTALYKSQEIQAHNGSIWSVKFSLDGRYLASAGEDCVIHVWQVVESERKGELLLEKAEDSNLNNLLMANGSPESSSLSPTVDNHPEKKRRGRASISRKSLSLDYIFVPDTVFALSDKPVCSFRGHLDDVLDLSWSKSQHLLSSSMDKTVRLWHLSSRTCLKIFSHSDYVTCIQFNPVDDRYFISGSLDAKVRIWSIPDHQVVDWNDLHEMVTSACYTPDGQGALVGSYKGSCRLYNTSENKLQQKCQINLPIKKKKSHQKKITGFQFAPGSTSEVFITSADSRIRVVDGVDLVHKFKGFRNTNSQISASLTANGKYVVSASEDSNVYVWKHEADSRPNRSKGVTVTRSYEHFHCQDVSVATPWPGIGDSWGLHGIYSADHCVLENNLDEVSTANHPPTPADDFSATEGSRSTSGCTNSPLHGIISSATNGYFFDRISATWPEEKLLLAAKNRSPCHVRHDISNGVNQNMPAWGMVIVTAGLRGELRTFQNFGLPIQL